MSDKTLKVGQNSCDLGGINFEENAFGDFPRKEVDRYKTISFNLSTMTPEEIKLVTELYNKVLIRICGS
jgi:hypothetical protein